MKKYKMLKSPQSNNEVKIEYYFNESLILMAEIFECNEENEQFESKKILYFDLSSLKSDTHYIGEYPVSSILTFDDEVKIDVINAVGDEWTDDEANPKWEEVEFEEFEIPEDAGIIRLEELVVADLNTNPNPMIELEKANQKIDQLETYVKQIKDENEALIMSTLEMMSIMLVDG